MSLNSELGGRDDSERNNDDGGFFAEFEAETHRRPRRTERTGGEPAHGCGGCGEVKPGVDLWAEDLETGEELWLCEACGDW